MPHPSGRPWIVAHRGASRVERGNTIAAFTAAGPLGADAVELDVRRTADGTLVVHHDAVIGGVPIVDMSRDRVATVAPHVPDLADGLEVCGGMWVNVEVKNDPADPDWDPDATVAARVADLLAGRRDIVISSFDQASVEISVAAGMRSGLILDHGANPLEALSTVDGIEMLFAPITSMRDGAAAPVVAAGQEAGIEIGVWWTDDPDEMQRLAAAGVGLVFTNVPDVALAAMS